MRVVLASILMLAVAIVFLGGVQGGEKDKAVTLKGTITCAKCDLAKETTCMTVIVAKDKDKKDVTYYFDTAGSKKYHKTVCTEAKPGSATGVVTTAGDKKTITVTEVKFDK